MVYLTSIDLLEKVQIKHNPQKNYNPILFLSHLYFLYTF